MRRLFVLALFLAMDSSLLAEMPKLTTQRIPSGEVLPPVFLKELRMILPNSGQIFSGTVLRVQHHNSTSSGALATTAIQFRVDEAIRGVRKGHIVVVTEWGGLWQSGEQYRPGQRVLLFLYPPSKLGLTSPVAGAGRLAVNRSGGVLGRPGIGLRSPIAIQRVIRAIREAETE